MPEQADLIFRPVDPSRKRPLKKCKQKQFAEDATVYRQQRIAYCGPRLLANAAFNPAVETVAATFFLNALTSSPSSADPKSQFMELAAPLFRATRDGSPLHLAVEALSLASLSKKPGMQNLDYNASKRYHQAVQSVSGALRDPCQSRSNTTLEAILLLASYEANSSSDNACEAWAHHIEGATAIVVARGANQICDEESLAIFRSVRAQMLANSIQKRKPMPHFPDPKGWCIDPSFSETASIDQSMRMASLLSRFQSTLAVEQIRQKVAEIETLLKEAYDLMQDMAEHDIRTSAEWRVRTMANACDQADIADIEHLAVWPLPYSHVYKDLDSVCKKNEDRMSQITCSSLVMDTLKLLFPGGEYRHDHRYLTAKARLQILVDDICASVPYCWYGEDLAPGGARNTPRQRTGELAVELREASLTHQISDSESLLGYGTIWSLFAASAFEEVPDLQRRWLRGRFAAIGLHYGLEESKITYCLNYGQ